MTRVDETSCPTARVEVHAPLLFPRPTRAWPRSSTAGQSPASAWICSLYCDLGPGRRGQACRPIFLPPKSVTALRNCCAATLNSARMPWCRTTPQTHQGRAVEAARPRGVRNRRPAALRLPQPSGRAAGSAPYGLRRHEPDDDARLRHAHAHEHSGHAITRPPHGPRHAASLTATLFMLAPTLVRLGIPAEDP